MAKTTAGTAHCGADPGKPAECDGEQPDLVRRPIRDIADRTMGGMRGIVTRCDKVSIGIDAVIPMPASEGFTTDPRMPEAPIKFVREQQPPKIRIGWRGAMGGGTRKAKYGGSSEEFANWTPIHANIPGHSSANYIAKLAAISQ